MLTQLPILALGIIHLLTPQQTQHSPDLTITPDIRATVIANALKGLNDSYVFPDVAKSIEAAIKAKVANKEYDPVTSARAFAKKLTEDLQTVSHDKHMRVRFSPQPIPDRGPDGGDGAEMEGMRKYAATVNAGFEKVERLPGNIGYMKFDGFMPAELAGDTVAAAMSFLANTDAMIIDLRDNGGGDPATVALVCTYFFENRTHLNDLYFRPDNTTEQYWTLPYVPGKKFIGKDLYVLTSGHTFSGAEEFCYNMQTQKRATLVGETTGGGANPGDMVKVHEHFGIFIPSGRAINPITKTNWEGVGVKPEVSCTAKDALRVAQLQASKKLLEKVKDEALKQELSESIASLEKGGGK